MRKYTLTIRLLALNVIFIACAKTTIQKTSIPKVIIDSYENMRNYRTGKFIYFADAAVFEDCETGVKHAVKPKEGTYENTEGYLALEKYYSTNVKEPGTPIYIELEGYNVSKNPEVEGWKNTIIPTVFKVIKKEESGCK
ncbi:hypothetical protein [Polaribacter tangerinus]|uniref:hypothetical protein n=1 Tax=Polaribacter tangerinus TaxID=1920034 RepID=UPI000B4B96B2|nr:hypothetical protein [Polaribacter tangerinus]